MGTGSRFASDARKPTGKAVLARRAEAITETGIASLLF